MPKKTDEKRTGISPEIERWFEELDKFNSVPFLFDREQPTTAGRQIFKKPDKDEV
jgi:hypothetical protein